MYTVVAAHSLISMLPFLATFLFFFWLFEFEGVSLCL